MPTDFNLSSEIEHDARRAPRASAELRSADHLPFSLIDARVVLPNGIERTSVVVHEGLIRRIGASHAAVTRRFRCDGDYLLPGLIELHTDNIERHLEPRPGAFWNTERAVLSHDAELAAAGITTAFDAVTLGGDIDPVARDTVYLHAIDSLESAAAEGLLRVEHRLHLRCELSDPRLGTHLAAISTRHIPRLVSLMDHTPGQGQWTDIERFRSHYSKRYGVDAMKLEALIARRQAAHAEYAASNRALALEFARRHACVVATHDAATRQEVTAAHRDACRIVEFPTSLEAARQARALDLSVVAGAPNLVRGGSHSGNVAATALASEGLVDVLSSDYCPSSLLHAVFLMAQNHGMPLHRAVACASVAPARLLGLLDRGTIEVDKRADLIRVRDTRRGPVIVSAWCAGRQVA